MTNEMPAEKVSDENKNLPLISVVVPVYNVEKYLDECVQSIISQTYSSLEIILVDDGSTDTSGKMCDGYAIKDSRIKVIHKPNGGLSDARNTGIKASTAAYITFIDSDDYISKDYIEYLYDLMTKYNTDISICAHTIAFESGERIYKGMTTGNGLPAEKEITVEEALEKILLDTGVDLSTWAKLYKKELFTGIEFPKGRLFEDTATTYRHLFKCKTAAYGGKGNYFYRIRKNSITTGSSFEKKMQLIENTNQMCTAVTEKFPSLTKACDRRKIWAYFSTLNQLYKSKDASKFKAEEKELINYLMNRKSIIKKGTEYSKRDKLAIQCLSFGKNFYKLAWKIYEKLTGK